MLWAEHVAAPSRKLLVGGKKRMHGLARKTGLVDIIVTMDSLLREPLLLGCE